MSATRWRNEIDPRVSADLVRITLQSQGLLHIALDTPSTADALASADRDPPKSPSPASFRIPGSALWWPSATSAGPHTSDGDIWAELQSLGIAGKYDRYRDRFNTLFGRAVAASRWKLDAWALLNELWNSHWLLDASLAGHLLKEYSYPGTSHLAIATRVVLEQKARVRKAQRQSQTLGEWAQACFTALPQIQYAANILRQEQSDENMKLFRLAEEMRVDLREAFLGAATPAVDDNRLPFNDWTVRARNDPDDLRHRTRARFTLPQNWETMVKPLDNRERLSLLGMTIAIMADAGWDRIDETSKRIEMARLLDPTFYGAAWLAAPIVARSKAINLPPGITGVNRRLLDSKDDSETVGPFPTIDTDAFRRAGAALRAEASRRRKASEHDAVRVIFLAQLLDPGRWKRVARRNILTGPYDVTKGLEKPLSPWTLAVWIIGIESEPPDCWHPECSYGRKFLGPRVTRDVAMPNAPRVVADQISEWLEQPRPFPLTFDVAGIILEVNRPDGRLSAHGLNFLDKHAPVWTVPPLGPRPPQTYRPC